jgi:hypothetical protein
MVGGPSKIGGGHSITAGSPTCFIGALSTRSEAATSITLEMRAKGGRHRRQRDRDEILRS